MAADIKKILAGMIGENNASSVRSSLKQATDILDKRGVARKEGDTSTSSAPTEDAAAPEVVLEAVDAAGATETAATVKAILDALGAADLLKPDADMTALTALLLKAVAKPEAAEETPGDVPAGDEATMAGEMMKSLTGYIARSTKDMGDIARGQVHLAEAIRAQADANATIMERLNALETQSNGRPRQASKASETVIDPENKNLKTVESALKKGLGDETTFLGIPVRKTS